MFGLPKARQRKLFLPLLPLSSFLALRYAMDRSWIRPMFCTCRGSAWRLERRLPMFGCLASMFAVRSMVV
jgi:hypothetical protein